MFKQFINDFTKTDYGFSHFGPVSFPTAKNSVSGKLFIILGCTAGFVIAALYIPEFLNERVKSLGYSFEIKIPGLFVAMIGVPIGGTVGKVIHMAISSGIKACRQSPPQNSGQARSSVHSSPPPIPSDEQEPSKTIKFSCPNCDQHIEAPENLIGSIVSCPSCSQNIHIGKRSGHNQQSACDGSPKSPPPIP